MRAFLATFPKLIPFFWWHKPTFELKIEGKIRRQFFNMISYWEKQKKNCRRLISLQPSLLSRVHFLSSDLCLYCDKSIDNKSTNYLTTCKQTSRVLLFAKTLISHDQIKSPMSTLLFDICFFRFIKKWWFKL